jgi:hypothetical protein
VLSCDVDFLRTFPLVHKTDGTRLVVGVGNRVLLYDAENGDLIESLRGDTNFN